MSLENISAQLKIQHNDKQDKLPSSADLPPIEKWNPAYCGEIDLQIKANGDWYYGGTIFKRLSLVKLFASVLLREVNKNKDDYFLVTPVEKVMIRVDDAPFVLTQWHWQDESNTVMVVSSNVGDEFILDVTHPITLNAAGEVYVTVRRNLLAKVHRNVYYQWVDLAKEVETENGTELMFTSAGYGFSLGMIN